MRKRALWTEPLFGEAKQFHQLRRFRLRRLLKVNIEGVMVAAGQNLKRLIKHNLGMLFSFLRFSSSYLIFPTIPDFFNRRVDFPTKSKEIFPKEALCNVGESPIPLVVTGMFKARRVYMNWPQLCRSTG
jgi:hypothetical protein